MESQFKTIYWGSDNSTEVRFEPATELPELRQITACMVVAHHKGAVAISRPVRGWGILGGHMEQGETAEECVRREALEEAAVELGELRLVGYWRTKKVFESSENAPYPSVGYQLLYVAAITAVYEFVPQLEIMERAFVSLDEMSVYHHAFDDFSDVFSYVRPLLEQAA